jgi:hypothetical protein
MRSNGWCFLIMACLLLWAIVSTYGFFQSTFQLGRAFGTVDVFANIVSRVNEGELSGDEAIDGLQSYYPDGTILDSNSMGSQIIEKTRNLAIECIEKTVLVDELKSDANSNSKKAFLGSELQESIGELLSRPSSGESVITIEDEANHYK